MADSGAVAGLLWDEWIPGQVKRRVADGLPGGSADARLLVVWLAATHDIGKATPAFACQVDSLAEAMRVEGLKMPSHKEMVNRKLAPHGLAGQVLLLEWLIERHGWSKSRTLAFTVIAGGHHGVPPTHTGIYELAARPSLLRTAGCESEWKSVQWELLDACADECAVGDRLAAWSQVRLPQAAQVLLSGIVIVADWIASNPDLFPYFPEARSKPGAERVAAAWRGLGLPAPWRALPPTGPVEEVFASRFQLPPGARVRPVQARAVELARTMPEPGLVIIEAPMGEGKTEGAFAVAEVFAARSGAGGVFVALPTMATGNAMFPRMTRWMEQLPGGDAGARSVLLAHAKAALNEKFAEFMRAGRRSVSAVDLDGAVDERAHRSDRRRDSAEAVAHQWLRGRKKGMLASFVVGTIDQLLFMGLKSRHLALRHLALAGKVVIIDEAHAYDTYMNAYLDQVLSWLGAYRVPVVVLSATLPAGRRRELTEAYTQTDGLTAVEEADGYPLITAVAPGNAPHVEAVGPSGRRVEVDVERINDAQPTLVDRLAEELADGGCALVVRNTVDRVLETAASLRARFGRDNVTVAHARFLDVDRAAKDADLLARFGPPETSGDRRPRGPHIVVASQVAEQSLDIDFDLLVTDLCPIDLLLQRMGRLHRHDRNRPARLASARCLVTGADWNASPVEPDKSSQTVYRRHALLRSAAVLHDHLESGLPVRLPDDISPLVQRAYGDGRVGPRAWWDAMDTAHDDERLHQSRQQEKAEAFRVGDVGPDGRAVIGWIDAGAGEADDTRVGRAQVRDSPESLEVLVVRRRADGTLTTVPWLAGDRGGRELPTDAVPDPGLGRIVASCGLRLPFVYSIPAVLDRAIAELEDECVPAWQARESAWLAGELILALDEDNRARLAGYDLRYDPSDGLEVIRDR